MPDNIDNITKIEDEINRTVNSEIDALLNNARKNAANMLSTADDKLLEDNYHLISDRTKQIKNEMTRLVSRKSFEASRETISHRNKIVEDMFSEVEKNILAWTKTPAYEKKMMDLLREANSIKKIGSDDVIFVKSGDVPFAEKLAADCGASIKADKTIKIGGLSVFYVKENQYVNKTLDDAFQSQKNSFVNNTEMQL